MVTMRKMLGDIKGRPKHAKLHRLIGSEGDPSKLRLRTYLYRVLSRNNGICQLASVQFPDSTRRAHVAQLIRFKGNAGALGVEEAEAAPLPPP